MVSPLVHSLPVVVGIALVALGLGGRVPLVTGVVLIVVGLLLR